MTYTLAQLAELLNAEYYGNPHTPILGLAPLSEVSPHFLVFADGEENINLAFSSDAAAVLLNTKPANAEKPYIIHDSPLLAFAELIEVFYPEQKKPAQIHPTACLGKQVSIGQNVYIGPYAIIEDHSHIGDNSVIHAHVVIQEHSVIGKNCEIHPHVTLYPRTQIKDKVIIHAGTVIGSDGFGYRFINGVHHKVPHVGQVIVEENVEIGANTVIDKATLGSTKIGKGTKIDNLVQIAHSVKIGEHNIICAFTGIAGSTTSGNHVIFAANVGVSDHVKIDDEVVLGARAGVPPRKHLKKGLSYIGNPARPKDKALEQEFSTTRIPYMRKHIQTMKEKIQELEEKIAQLMTEVC